MDWKYASVLRALSVKHHSVWCLCCAIWPLSCTLLNLPCRRQMVRWDVMVGWFLLDYDCTDSRIVTSSRWCMKDNGEPVTSKYWHKAHTTCAIFRHTKNSPSLTALHIAQVGMLATPCGANQHHALMCVCLDYSSFSRGMAWAAEISLLVTISFCHWVAIINYYMLLLYLMWL